MATSNKEGILMWEPSDKLKESSNMARYVNWLKEYKGLTLDNYRELWEWSTTDLEGFWSSIWDFFEIQSSTPYNQVLTKEEMPGAGWFVGSTLNYAEHIFRHSRSQEPAVIFKSELKSLTFLTWEELHHQVASVAWYLKTLGVKRGDRVVAYVPNIPEALVAFLACASIGVIWSSCSPDFGSSSVIDRFKQIEPKILFTIDGYRYGGKDFKRLETVKTLQEKIPSLEITILIPYLDEQLNATFLHDVVFWDEIVNEPTHSLTFEQVPFDHPLWILYSSGTTGIPKAIVQGHGGILLEHLKMEALHMDLQPQDRFFWFTTTGWMMWNVLVSGLLTGAAVLMYDGNPGYPNLNTLWKFAEETKMTYFGTSASFLTSCKKAGLHPGQDFDLSSLKAIGSTGSPLSPEGFHWVYDKVKRDLWLGSASGGTDICAAFVGSSPLLPVHSGEIQCRALGASVQAYDDTGNAIVNDIGELVVTKPMPSMPLYFWNDRDNKRYKKSYFDMYSGVWRHGDFIKITPRGTCVIYGRSDSTINRGGIRIGTSEIYSAVERVPEVLDSLVVEVPKGNAESLVTLFVVLKKGTTLTEHIKREIKTHVREHCSPRHVPDEIYQIGEVPRTLNGKKVEVPIKKILMGKSIDEAVNVDSLSNPSSLNFFVELAQKQV